MALCKHCGHRVSEGAAFCDVCGQELNDTNNIQADSVAPSAQSTTNTSVIRKPLLYTFVAIIALVLGLYIAMIMKGDLGFGYKPLKHISECRNPISEPLEFDDTYFDFDITELSVKMSGDTLVVTGTVHNNMDYRASVCVYIGVYDEDGERKDFIRCNVGAVAGQGSSEIRFEGEPNCANELVYYNLEAITI